MKFDCLECSLRFELSPQNAEVYTFTASVKHSYADITCPECGYVTTYFFDLGDRNMLNVLSVQLRCSNTRKALPDEQVKEAYEVAASGGKVSASPRELSPRHEAEIASLCAALDSTPIDLLMELFATPPPKSTMPINWAAGP